MSMRCILRRKLCHCERLGQLMCVVRNRTCAQVLQTSKAAYSLAAYEETGTNS